MNNLQNGSSHQSIGKKRGRPRKLSLPPLLPVVSTSMDNDEKHYPLKKRRRLRFPEFEVPEFVKINQKVIVNKSTMITRSSHLIRNGNGSIYTEKKSSEKNVPLKKNTSVPLTPRQQCLKNNNTRYSTNNRKSYICSMCTMSIEGFKLFNEHVQNKHPKAKNGIRCSVCKNTFKSNTTLKKHIQLVHTDKPLMYACEKCNFKTKRQYDLRRHFFRMHTEAIGFSRNFL